MVLLMIYFVTGITVNAQQPKQGQTNSGGSFDAGQMQGMVNGVQVMAYQGQGNGKREERSK